MRKCKVCGKFKEDTEFYGKTKNYTCKRCVCERNSRIVYERNLIKEPSLEGEIWQAYPNNRNYLISTLGRVRGRSGRILHPAKHRQGYLCLKVGRSHCLVHRLVAETFIPNPEHKATVNHINGDKSDNGVVNLEWATQQENNQHAHRTGLAVYTIRQWESATRGYKITKPQAEEIKFKFQSGKSLLELSIEYNISKAQVCRIVNGKSRNSKYQIK